MNLVGRRPEGLNPLSVAVTDELRVQRRRLPTESQEMPLRFVSVESPIGDDPLADSFSTVDGDATAWSHAGGSSPPSTPLEDTFPAARRAYYRRGDMRPRYMRMVFVLVVMVIIIGTYPTDRAQELKEIQELYGITPTNRTSAHTPSTLTNRVVALERSKIRTASPHRYAGGQRRESGFISHTA